MQARDTVRTAKRIVVKVGSSSLAPGGALDAARLDTLVRSLALATAGRELVLVTSGAVAAGLQDLGLTRRPSDMALLQAAASVGQGVLVEAYRQAWAREGRVAAQVLLSARDTTERTSFVNARRALDALLARSVVPVVNENDAVATEELRFGDNDHLAALVAVLVDADALVLLSDVAGVMTAPPSQGGVLVDDVSDVEAFEVDTRGGGSGLGTGGMTTKVSAAKMASAAGVATLVGGADDVLGLLGGVGGTSFAARASSAGARNAWLRWAAAPSGELEVDAGAAAALRGRRSLLGVGVLGVKGSWEAREVVDVTCGGVLVARARTLVASRDALSAHVVVHADDTVVL